MEYLLGAIAVAALLVWLAWSRYRERLPLGSGERLPRSQKPFPLAHEDAEGYLQRADAYFSRGRDEEAMADFTRCIELDPNLAAGYYSRGCALLEALEADEPEPAAVAQAFADLEKARELDPKLESDPFLNLGLGALHKAYGNYAEARRRLERVIDLAPDSSPARTAREDLDTLAELEQDTES